MNVLYLIDASNMLHRAAAAGDEVLEGLDHMLRRFVRVASPRYAAACWDGKDSFRRALFADYKGDRTRSEKVDQAAGPARNLFGMYGITNVEPVEGCEADDLIGTLARKSPAELQVLMMSNDRDLLQLVDERTFLGVRRGGRSRTWRPGDVRAAFGIEPAQWADVMALAGAKNNVPGLPGIGFRGACDLIAKYGDLETLLRKFRQVPKPSYRYALEGGPDDARLYRQLLTIRTDMPIEWEEERFHAGPGPCPPPGASPAGVSERP